MQTSVIIGPIIVDFYEITWDRMGYKPFAIKNRCNSLAGMTILK